MSNLKDLLELEAKNLRTTRDELRVRAHLGRADFNEAWEKVEGKWHRLEGELKRLNMQSRGPVDEVEQGLRDLMAEVRDGYRRMTEAMHREA